MIVKYYVTILTRHLWTVFVTSTILASGKLNLNFKPTLPYVEILLPVLLGCLLTHVLQQRHHVVVGSAVEELRVSLTFLPLSLDTVTLFGLLDRLETTLLDSGVLE